MTQYRLLKDMGNLETGIYKAGTIITKKVGEDYYEITLSNNQRLIIPQDTIDKNPEEYELVV